MSGSRSRDKGARGELEFARELPYSAHRGRQYHGGPDSPDVKTDDGIHWEVKRTEALRLYEALSQAKDEADGVEVPAVAFRRNRSDWHVVVSLEDLQLFCERFLIACGRTIV